MTGRITTYRAVSAVALVACAVLAVTGFDAAPKWERMDVGQLRKVRGGETVCYFQVEEDCRAHDPCEGEADCEEIEGLDEYDCTNRTGIVASDPENNHYWVVRETEPPFGNEGYLEGESFICTTNQKCAEKCGEVVGFVFCVEDMLDPGGDDPEIVSDTLVDGDTCDQQS